MYALKSIHIVYHFYFMTKAIPQDTAVVYKSVLLYSTVMERDMDIIYIC